MVKKLIDYLLLLRFYTVPNIVLVAILASVFARGGFFADYSLLFDVVFALLVWTTMVYLNEIFYKNEEDRLRIASVIPVASFIAALAMAAVANYLAIPLLFVALIATLVYRLKPLDWFGSGFVFVGRGFTEFAIFLSVALFNSPALTNEIIVVGIILWLITNSRNLIGDLRDMEFDKHTFPNKYGMVLSRIVSIVFMLAAIALTPALLISLPLMVMIVLVLLHKRVYFIHYAFVLSTGFYLANYLSYQMFSDLFVVNFVYIAVLLSLTYKSVPRKANEGNDINV